jgi:hypothetical protein
MTPKQSRQKAAAAQQQQQHSSSTEAAAAAEAAYEPRHSVENYHYFSKTTTVCFIIILLMVINIRHSHFSGNSVVFSRACTIAAVQTSYGNIAISFFSRNNNWVNVFPLFLEAPGAEIVHVGHV